MRLPSPRPSDCIRLANFSAGGAILSIALFASASSARSMNTAPGIWPASYSARASRPASAVNFVASTTRRSDAPSSRSSQSVETKASMLCSCCDRAEPVLPVPPRPSCCGSVFPGDGKPMPRRALFQARWRSASANAALQQKSSPSGRLAYCARLIAVVRAAGRFTTKVGWSSGKGASLTLPLAPCSRPSTNVPAFWPNASPSPSQW